MHEDSEDMKIIRALTRQLTERDEELSRILKETTAEVLQAHKCALMTQETSTELMKRLDELIAANLELQKENRKLKVELEQERIRNLTLRNNLLDLANEHP